MKFFCGYAHTNTHMDTRTLAKTCTSMSAKELNRKWFLVPGDAKIGLWLAGWLAGF